MFDNVAFEVAIGLVFVYLLYSLLITILGELIATWLGLRARILRTAIERMLNDGYYKEVQKKKWLAVDVAFKVWYWITNKCRHFFLYQSSYFKSSFAGRFYSYPSIKYLSRLEGDQKVFFENTKPAYITSENFASTLINFLSDKGNGRTKLEQLRFALKYNTLHIQPETAKNIRAILTDSGNDINMFKERLMTWYDEIMDRATGWYKRKIRLILFWLGFLVALSFNVDSISIARILANDKEARNQLVSMGIALSKDSARYGDFVNKDGDSVHSKEILDSGYSHITKDINQANLVLGLGWDFSRLRKKCEVTVDSTDETNYKDALQLQPFNAARKEREAALKSINDTGFLVDSLSQQALILTTQLQLNSLSLKGKTNDPVLRNDSLQARSALDSLTNSIALLQVQLKHDSDVLSGMKLFISRADRQVQLLTKNTLTGFDSAIKKTGKAEMVIYGSRNYTWTEKTGFVLGSIFGKSSRLLGLLLTTFALSLGAPFWFGVLNKLVSLRATGVKPDDKSSTDNSPALSNHPVQSFPTSNSIIPGIITADEADIALDAFTLKIYNEPGIVAIGLAPEGDNPSAFISVMTESEDIKNYLRKKYGDAEVMDNDPLLVKSFSIPVQYSVADSNTTHNNPAVIQQTEIAGNEIANISGALGSGTLGCFLLKKGSDKRYMLSCWHVMKDNANWEAAIIKPEIVDLKKITIGKVENGCLADTIDAGIAVCNEDVNASNTNGAFSIKAQHREVKAFDALASTPVQLYGKVCQYQTATVFLHKVNARIKYPDGRMHLMQDVFSITKDMRAPTGGGDSGAVVTDMNGVPLGLVIGGNGTFSYAVKFTNMFSENKLYNEYSFLI